MQSIIRNASQKCFLLKLNFSICSRSLSSNVVSNYLPKNVQLADISILQPEEKLKISEEEYYFPICNIPETTVRQFSNPGETSLNSVVNLNPKIFGVAIRKDIVLEVVRYQRNKARQPNKTKRIGEISGSTKKPHPQKGTGRAQAGNRRASHWKGGQKAHGPVLRDYSISLNRKYRALGMMIALAAKLREGNLIIFDKLELEAPRTKVLAERLKSHGLADLPTLLVDSESQVNLERAASNLALVTYVPQHLANVYDIVKRDRLLISVDALHSLQDRVWRQYTHRGKAARLLREAELRQQTLAASEATVQSA